MNLSEMIQGCRKIRAVFLLAWTVAIGLLPVWGAESGELFNQANRLYEQGRFPEAAAAYERIAEKHGVSAELLFNLGNARLKAGRVGWAVQAYRQAQALAPRDPDIRANLNFAREQAGNASDASRWTRWLGNFTLNEWTLMAAVALAGWFLLLAFGQWRMAAAKSLRPYTRAMGVAAFVLVICLIVVVQTRIFSKTVVVVTSEAVVRRGPFEESQSAFVVRDGMELSLVGRKDDWLEVSDAQNRVGWIQSRQITFLQ